MADKEADNGIARMIALRSELEQRLLLNADYRAFIALTKAINEATPSQGYSVASEDSGAILPFRPPTQSDAAAAVLAERGCPLPIGALVTLVTNKGAVVGGQDRATNLSSVLSRDEHRFRSVRYHGRSCWWLKDRPYPGETDLDRRSVEP